MRAVRTAVIAPFLAALAATSSVAESPMHAGRLAHELDRLASTGRVLYVAAHPDDENTRLLAHLANERHVHAAYLSMTRGGGGQNLIGDEQGDLLDVIRTEELLAARSIDGATQLFTRMRDFGYSKSADETLATWGREEALADVVRVVRAFRPDVVIARFDEKPPNHGHHTASAILAREAFAAAADPRRFPEHLREGLEPWQARRLLWNVSTFREGPIPEDAVAVDVGGYDARLGLSMGEVAALSRSRHQSQGFGVAGERGKVVERFVLLAGEAGSAGDPILGGIDLGWSRHGEAGAALAAALDEARRRLDRDAPEGALDALVRARAALAALPDADPRVRDAREHLAEIVAAAAGVFVRATAPSTTVVPGGSLKVDVELVARRPGGVTLSRLELPGREALVPGRAVGAEKVVVSETLALAADTPVSAPHWLARPPETGRHVVTRPELAPDPAGPAPLAVAVELDVHGGTFRLERPVVHAWVDPVLGERTRRVLVVPPATVTPARAAVMLVNGRPGTAVLHVRAGRDAVRGEVALDLPPGWRATPARAPVELARAGDQATVRFEVAGPEGAPAIEARPSVTVDGAAWSWSEAAIDHPHVPLQLVLRPAQLRLVPLSIALPAGRFGYVPGSGDSTAEDLAHVGLPIETIDAVTLREGDLSRFDGILVGIRAFNVRDDVRAALPRLVDFAARGGTVVVQYQTNNRLAPLSPAPGPYPFEIGRDRITDETAAMTPVDPAHAALARPNAIGPADFGGWVQERSIYHASTWDERYRPLLAAADPGEQPLPGGTIVARHGEGRWVYTGLVFFRQLPAGAPGAYRLLANLLAREEAP